jgi:hypothetical protein
MPPKGRAPLLLIASNNDEALSPNSAAILIQTL